MSAARRGLAKWLQALEKTFCPLLAERAADHLERQSGEGELDVAVVKQRISPTLRIFSLWRCSRAERSAMLKQPKLIVLPGTKIPLRI